MNIKNELTVSFQSLEDFALNDVKVSPETIKTIMINEVVPHNSADDFYGGDDSAYLSTVRSLFKSAGVDVTSAQDILELGIYMTNAVKKPKTGYDISMEAISDCLPILEKELLLFPNVKVIMLMGDVAKKAFNRIAKKEIGRNPIPSTATYKLRDREFYYENIRIFPSYIMTGKNILIEKSKFEMVTEDIEKMMRLIK